jgi:serine/threonine-protein kinase
VGTPIQVPNQKPSGTVIGQDPLGGTKADKGSTVTLKVSTGPGNVTIPSVVGLPKADAIKKLKRAGLKIGAVQPESSSTVPNGDATRTDPRAGQSQPAGTSITLFVSSGKPMVNLPDVTGEDLATAKGTLTGDGFNVKTVKQSSNSAQPNTVISQSPSGNTQQPKGSTVTLTVAQAPTTVNVPDVKGDSAAQASNALQAAGFSVTQQTQTVKKASKNGIVIRQSPGAGQSAKKGSTVRIVVGHYTAPPPPTTTTPSTTTTPTTTTTT